jgi:fatty-acyl-CoA synthase
MTETSPVSFQSSVDDPVALRVATIGRVHPHLEVKIVDADGRIVPRGVKGELLTRGYSVMLGYWGDEEKTRETIDAARWMHTGDLAVIDEQGFATIVGRAKDMVIRGGENIYPREIEEFLYRHPKVLDVQCVGVPDRNTARNCAPASCCVPARRRTRTRSAISAKGRSPITRFRAISASCPRSR